MEPSRVRESLVAERISSQKLFGLAAPAALVLVLVLAVFGKSIHYDFISYDDPIYVFENETVTRGLTSSGVVWAAKEVGETNLWHPLTWLSHMVDVEIFGVENAGGHHAVNVFWHALGSVGLFFLMRRITGSTGISLFLAVVWAVHPQRVQSVMWISERKDVLSGAFFMWSWWSWEKWRSPQQGHIAWYGLALSLFLLAGLSKPSVVPLPLILWLREMLREPSDLNWENGYRWAMRVLPFVVISALVAGLTVYFQRIGGMANVTDVMPASRRLILMPVGLWWYLRTFLYPAPGQLWVYPPQGMLLDWLLPLLGLVVFSTIVLFAARKQRLMLLGAGVFFLLWLPVSGIVPVSFYFVADRYSYLIQLGLLIVCAGLVRILAAWATTKVDKTLLAATGVLSVIMLIAVSWGRGGHWKNSEILFTHERTINPRSLLAPIHLGSEMEERGEYENAAKLYKEALAIDSESGLAATNLGKMLEKLGRRDQAEKIYLAASQKKILHNPTPFINLARLLIERGDLTGAEKALQDAMTRFPERASLMVDMGSLTLSYKKNSVVALEWYEKALEIEPLNPDAMQGKAVILLESGRIHEGKELLQKLLRHHPEREAVKRFMQTLR